MADSKYTTEPMKERFVSEQGWTFDNPNKIFQFCFHCGEECKKDTMYCDACKTKAGRLAIDEENKALGVVCKKCL